MLRKTATVRAALHNVMAFIMRAATVGTTIKLRDVPDSQTVGNQKRRCGFVTWHGATRRWNAAATAARTIKSGVDWTTQRAGSRRVLPQSPAHVVLTLAMSRDGQRGFAIRITTLGATDNSMDLKLHETFLTAKFPSATSPCEHKGSAVSTTTSGAETRSMD